MPRAIFLTELALSILTNVNNNFLFYVYVPDYFVTVWKTYTVIGHVNKYIRDMLNRFGLQKYKVEVIVWSSLKKELNGEDLDNYRV